MADSARRRRIDPRRAKTHYSYTVAEAAALFSVHRNTVRNWIRRGLRTVSAGRLVLILGSELRDYLTRTKAQRRTRCGAGAMYCLKCRGPRRPPAELIEIAATTATAANLRGLCPECGTFMHRRASLERLAECGFAAMSGHAAPSAPSR
jgi:excisionase family DNA binding protein